MQTVTVEMFKQV